MEKLIEKLPPKPKLPRRLPRIEKLEEVPRYLEEQGALLDDLNVRLQMLLEVTEKMQKNMQLVPEGIVLTIERTITGQGITELNLEREPEAHERPWFSTVVTSDEDSESNVYVAFNTTRLGWRKLRPSESAEADFHSPKLKKIFFKCAAATDTANVIIMGEY